MMNLIKTNSTKSSISGKATSLNKSMQKGAKAIACPFKKLKKSISTVSTPSICSCQSSITISISDNENADRDEESSINSQGDSNKSEPEVKLTPQEELSMSFIIILLVILIISMQALQEHWCLPIYTFFKPDVVFQYHEGWPSHFFTYTTPKCKVHAHGICQYQDSQDKASTANLKHHTLHCFGQDAVNAAIARHDHTNHNHGIFTLFACKGKQPVKYSHHVHTNPEVQYVSTIYSYTNVDH